MLPTISLGPIVIPTGIFTYLVGIWLALTIIERNAPYFNLDPTRLYNLAAISLGTGFVGARLTFIFLYWSAFADNPLALIWPLTNGFSFTGGLFFTIAGGFFYQRYHQMAWPESINPLIPGLIVLLATASLADFVAGPGIGTETAVPWAIDLFGIQRHPVQLYELLTAILALIIFYLNRGQRPFSLYPALLTTATYSTGRLITDAFHANPPLIGDGWHTIQLISLITLLISLALLAMNSE
ncbi:MAG TPA: prolipoprotein diacylglyceryl transferase family protein [Anaerolineae bacterium]|nr:prolipoprotein diacylglyceryl transferase family protein [Anaerolineae bacterium]